MTDTIVTVPYEAAAVQVEPRLNRLGLTGALLVAVAVVAGMGAVTAAVLALVAGFTGHSFGFSFWGWQQAMWLAAGIAFVFAVVGLGFGHAGLSPEARDVGGHEIGFSVLVFGYGVLAVLVVVLLAVPFLLLLL